MVRQAPSWAHKPSLQTLKSFLKDIFIRTIIGLGVVFVGTLKEI